MATAFGGIPHVVRGTFSATGRKVTLPFFSGYLIVRNQGANPARLYFIEQDYVDDVNYVVIPVAAATAPHGEWQGPVETAQDTHADLYLRGAGGSTDIELVSFQRRG